MQAHIRPINRGDLELLLAWRSLLPPYATRDGKTPAWEDHLAWFENRDDLRLDFVIIHQGRKVGTVGINRVKEPWISIHVAEPGLRRAGIATAACKEILSMLKSEGWTYCLAEVSALNTRSQAFFRELGFIVEIDQGKWQRWRKPLD